ncbi:MAG TPA: hypothetical protein VLX68_14690 [Chitinivibrionales bacterium]|nr:hypothetical protein [Chitinivibrionales bacterium]
MKQINTIKNPFIKFSDKNPVNHSQITRILTSAIKRATEAVTFFEQKECATETLVQKAFYNYLSVKKDAQRVIIEKIVHCLGIELAPRVYLMGEEKISLPPCEGIDEGLEHIFKNVHETAADELEFYLSYAAVEKDERINAILLMLADLSREFLFDVKIWYLNHKKHFIPPKAEKQEIIAPDYTVVTALN